eukprot:jgi/Mesvir1/16275/Mv08519-RA.1
MQGSGNKHPLNPCFFRRQNILIEAQWSRYRSNHKDEGSAGNGDDDDASEDDDQPAKKPFGVSAVQPYPAFFVTLDDVCVPISLVAKHFVKLCGPNVVLVISTPASYTVDAHGRASLGTMASTPTPTAPVHDDRPKRKAKARSDSASHSEGKARPASTSDGLSLIRELAAAHADGDKRGDLLNWERQSQQTRTLLREKMREEPRLKRIIATYLNEKMTAHLKYKAALARKIRRDAAKHGSGGSRPTSANHGKKEAHRSSDRRGQQDSDDNDDGLDEGEGSGEREEGSAGSGSDGESESDTKEITTLVPVRVRSCKFAD